uniref:Uncharacterized protein n=1 Tax=Cyanothece sp. (strain PCC 7425 / ATCC 29141) TaxID=395961 RepID=B8HZM9_CYAP4
MKAVLPVRLPNASYRSREYLTLAEVNQLIEAAGDRGRHPLRVGKATSLEHRSLNLMMFRHGLRAGKVELLRWDSILAIILPVKPSVDFEQGISPTFLALNQGVENKTTPGSICCSNV